MNLFSEFKIPFAHKTIPTTVEKENQNTLISERSNLIPIGCSAMHSGGAGIMRYEVHYWQRGSVFRVSRASLSSQFYARLGTRCINRKMISSAAWKGPSLFERSFCAKTCLSRCRETGVGGFGLPSPCVAPQVSSIPFIGKYAIHSFHGTPRSSLASKNRGGKHSWIPFDPFLASLIHLQRFSNWSFKFKPGDTDADVPDRKCTYN